MLSNFIANYFVVGSAHGRSIVSFRVMGDDAEFAGPAKAKGSTTSEAIPFPGMTLKGVPLAEADAARNNSSDSFSVRSFPLLWPRR